MKFTLLFALTALAWVSSVGAEEPIPNPPTALSRDVDDLADQLRNAKDQILDLEKRLDAVERRLGETYRASSPFNTIERRLEDLEKEVNRR